MQSIFFFIEISIPIGSFITNVSNSLKAGCLNNDWKMIDKGFSADSDYLQSNLIIYNLRHLQGFTFQVWHIQDVYKNRILNAIRIRIKYNFIILQICNI